MYIFVKKIGVMNKMKIVFLAFGLFMIFEGFPYFAWPDKMKELLAQLMEMPESSLRKIGFAMMITGLMICYLVQKTAIFQ